MNKTLLSALVLIGATAGATAPHATSHGPDWRPVTRGLTESPDRLLPAVISPTHPVRVVSTALDHTGRPVVTTSAATDRDTAARLVADGQRQPGAIGVELDAPVSVAGADALLEQQWDLNAVRVAEAWPRSTGAGVTVAVIDTGVDASHPDLAGQVLPGADFIAGMEGIATDPNGHGTHVAGTIAAATGNDTGIAGMAPDARILPIRVLGANGSGYMSDVANGIVYAAEHGADVINLSISSTSQVGAVTNAVAYARSRGAVVVAAAGNNRASGSPTAFPAADDGVLAVAATDSADRVASYSNRGGYVDVAAPGNDIVSTFPIALGTGGYRRMNGTSMAAPHVTALAALLKGADRTLTPEAIEQAVTSSAADLGVPGRDDDFGAGRIDAAAALATLAPPPAPVPSIPVREQQPPAEPTAPATEEPTTPQPTAPAPDPTTPSPDPTTPSPAPTTPDPTTPDPTTPSPGPTAPSPGPTAPSPDPTTPSPDRTTPSPERTTPSAEPTPAPTAKPLLPVAVRVYKVGTQLIVGITEGVDGQTVELQRQTTTGWETVSTYPAIRVMRFTSLPNFVTYRIAVPSSARYAPSVSNAVLLWPGS